MSKQVHIHYSFILLANRQFYMLFKWTFAWDQSKEYTVEGNNLPRRYRANSIIMYVYMAIHSKDFVNCGSYQQNLNVHKI